MRLRYRRRGGPELPGAGDRAWPIIDRLANKYIGMDYPRERERVVLLIEPDHAQYIRIG